MPCWEENLISLDFSEADQDLLASVLEKFPGVELRNGKVLVALPEREQQIRQAYAEAVVEQAAEVQGWTVWRDEETGTLTLER